MIKTLSVANEPSPKNGEVTPLHRVLWTSGWDSTFRVLDLVSRGDCTVQPYYLLNWNRRSRQIEIERMNEITAAVALRGWTGKLLPVKVVERPDSSRDAEIDHHHLDIRKAWDHLHEEIGLGKQYRHLAIFAREQGLKDLETGVLGFDKMGACLRGKLATVLHDGEPVQVLDAAPDDPLQPIFGNMRFPLFGKTKTEMQAIARKRGFLDLLERSWFCHEPLRNDAPCGLCTPCHDALTRGMAYRIGWRGRMLARLPGWSRRIGRGILGRT